ncbi:response regulator [Vallitalea pronyensis]|uniref:Stage 0 sporulation protein A homolog n=1 Tax=Vallitalea pronyensis TaxID=1348613 RepID=A0A8J8SGF4_9FIRM|nr:response regulator [Vallitalea pronyensis]QUI22302.1 response regulator [Vallitalea pronyensis]
MYNMLIVDDEQWISQGLATMVKRMECKDIGDIIYKFSGKDGLDAFQQNTIDLILTDICMPEMSGLTFIEAIRKKSDVPIGVISGYEDFVYVDKAYKQGIVGYMLKPIMFEELKEIIDKMISILKRREEEHQWNQKRDTMYTHTLIENKINRFLQLVRQNDESHMSITREMEGIFPFPYYAVGLVKIKKSEHKVVKEIEDEMANIYFEGTKKNVYHMIDYKNDLVIIFNFLEPECYKDVCQYMENLKTFAKDKKEDIVYSISSYMHGFQNIYTLHNEAYEANRYNALIQQDQVIKYGDYAPLKKSGKEDFQNKIKHFQCAVEITDKKAMMGYIDELFTTERLKHYCFSLIEWLYKTTCHVLSQLVQSNEVEMITEDISQFLSIKELRIYLKSWILKNINEKEELNYQSPVELALEFIKHNYHKDISLTYVSNVVSLNYSYFSKLFKEYTGMKFIDYLTQFRLSKAKEMLEDSTWSIEEISKSVGYKNYRHFTTSFKRQYHIKPSEMRKKRQSSGFFNTKNHDAKSI